MDATWTTSDGRVLRIKDMDTQHIRNAVSMIRRRDSQSGWNNSPGVYDALRKELMCRDYSDRGKPQTNLTPQRARTMYTKEKPYAVEGHGPLTKEEADSIAAQEANRSKRTVYIMKVVATVSPKSFDVITEAW